MRKGRWVKKGGSEIGRYELFGFGCGKINDDLLRRSGVRVSNCLQQLGHLFSVWFGDEDSHATRWHGKIKGREKVLGEGQILGVRQVFAAQYHLARVGIGRLGRWFQWIGKGSGKKDGRKER